MNQMIKQHVIYVMYGNYVYKLVELKRYSTGAGIGLQVQVKV